MNPDTDPMKTTAIEAERVTVRYGDSIAISDFSLSADAGDLVALVGPSGCGKTTSLRAIAGFESITEGSIEIRGSVVSDAESTVPPEKRKVGMVFQEYALFPHISVAENIGYGIRGADRVERVAEVMHLVGLDGYGKRFPHELSGGEQQRVALARALAPQPDVVLLDEPFSNLDAPQRERMRRELRKIIKSAGVTAILVTHDQSEALAIADVIAVMSEGRVLQVGLPEEVYAQPVTPWVAKFLGDAVLFDGTVADGVVPTMVGGIETTLPDGTPAQVMIRPEWILPRLADGSGSGTVIDREFYGHDQRIEIRLNGGTTIEALVPTRTAVRVSDSVEIEILDAIVYEVAGA